MANYGQSSCTLSTITDVEAVYTYYYLASSTITVAEAPKDNINPPGASTITVISDGNEYIWQITEPELDIEDDVIRTAVGRLYLIECVKFSNGTYDWGPLMTSSTYAAAKAAYNLSSQAIAAAQSAVEETALLGGHFIYNSNWQTSQTPHSANVVQTVEKNGTDVSTDPTKWDYNVHIGANGIKLRNNESVLSEWLTNALRFYHPGTTNKGMELSNNTLKFYDSTGTVAQATFGGTRATVSGTINAYSGQFGSSSNNFWVIDTFYNADNQQNYSSLHSKGESFIQLGDTNTWTLATDKINSSWRYMSTSADGITNPFLFRYKRFGTTTNDGYYDYGLHIPTVLNTSDQNTKLLADKFLYIRHADYVTDSNLGNLNDDSEWTYPFYVDSQGNVRATAFYIGTSNVPVGGGAGTVAERLTQGYGNATTPVYFDSNGRPAVTNLDSVYLSLTGGTVTGATTFGSSVTMDEATVGDLVVNGAASFTNGLIGDLQGNADTATNVEWSGVLNKPTTLSGYGITDALSNSLKGANNGLAELDNTGKVPSSQLPSYVDDVLEYANKASFPASGETGKIYIDKSDNKTYRWGGSSYTEISASLALGETSSTAYRGDRGKVAYDHATAKGSAFTSGLYKITTNSEGHVTAATAVEKSDITALGIPAQDTTYSFSANNPTLAWGTESTIGTAGSTTYKVTMPSNPNTDTKVTQTNTTGTNAEYRVLFSENANDTTQTVGARKNTNFKYNPSTGAVTATTFIGNLAGTATGNLTSDSSLAWSKITGAPTTLSGYGITDVNISNNGVITLGNSTITPLTSHQDISGKADKSSTVTNVAYNSTSKKITKTINGTTSDVVTVATLKTDLALSKSDVGLGNVLNYAQVTGIGSNDGKLRVYKGENYEDVEVEIVATESTTAVSASKLSSYGGANNRPIYIPSAGANQGKPVAIDYEINKSVPSNAVFTDTTYTFTNGTNGFTVTPSGGTAQTVTVTPSIANNVTGSGTSGSLVKFSGANTVTNGPVLGSDTTKFLNNKGEWAVPGGTYELNVAKYNTLGGVKPAYSSTGAAVLTTAAATNTSTPTIATKTTTSGRYYAVETDKNGVLFVNVPWTDTTYTIPTVTQSATTGISIASHKTETITGVGGTTTVSKVTIGEHATDYGVKTIGQFTQGTDTFVANTPTRVDTSKFNGGSYSHSGFTGGSYTHSGFTGGSLQINYVESDLRLDIAFQAAAYGNDNFTPATYGTDTFVAASLGNGFYTVGTAATFTQGTDNYTPPTLGSKIPTVASEAVTVAQAASSATTVVTSGTHSITDNGHTHNI